MQLKKNKQNLTETEKKIKPKLKNQNRNNTASGLVISGSFGGKFLINFHPS